MDSYVDSSSPYSFKVMISEITRVRIIVTFVVYVRYHC